MSGPAATDHVHSSFVERIEDKNASVEEKVGVEEELQIEPDASGPRRPLWKRIFAGDADDSHQTKRGMGSRHLTMIAIGGTIGTGIFLSAGEARRSFAVFGTRFVSPALGFTLGWNYWIQCELTAAAVILQFWDARIRPWGWALIIIAPIFIMQLIHVRVYGESEYWFAMIKVILIILFIIVGLIYDWGGIHKHPGPASLPNFIDQGLSNFQNGQAFIGGFSAFAQTFADAFYSYGGVELVSLAAGEYASPHKSVPRAVRATFFRILLFYILTILTIGLCINWDDPTLLNSAYNSDVAASPVTVVFQRAGFGAAVHVVNAVLLTAVLSAINSCFYASSRMLLSLAQNGHAPRMFGWVNRRGVPVPALVMALAISFLTFLTDIWGEGVVFTWLLNLTGISALLTWGSIGPISLRFRQAWKAQGRLLDDLPYKQPLFPLLPLVTIILATLMFTAEGYSAVVESPFDWRNVVATYIGVALYILLYVGYTLYELLFLGKWDHFVPLLHVDLDTDAVWGPGEGRLVKERELQEKQQRQLEGRGRIGKWIRRAFSSV
ncbi:uncharacterized protein LAESUDRAFT_736951 [Laetiporus sulphureus 93-53]|uniref:Amino acid permease/ SLC12A domain-containing protein n=1 Tax=Laetiporus sulphureus 93-53 TaxID=1314785 RepID=A0A165E9Y3_9APHY|nr:uncharacterized protein LAESUDRAFT_736951 [Laetiporus sulphureus 93-53]KZT06560.1 hypothetical protein LAESUDRAFT_736951 [Laetiporus sulphureus 93-53]